MKQFVVIAGFIVCLSLVFPPKTFSQVELFGGYSYLRANPGNNRAAEGANGWEGSLSAKLLGPFGAEADFSNHYGISPGSFFPTGSPLFTSSAIGGYVPAFTALYGPRFTIPSLPRTEPFVHALFGTAHGIAQRNIPLPDVACSAITGCPHVTANQTQSAFAMAFGGGLDIKATHHMWVRLIQVDYMRTQFSGSPENHVRISAGLVLRFGRW